MKKTDKNWAFKFSERDRMEVWRIYESRGGVLRRVATAPCPDWKGDVTSFGGDTEKEEKGEKGGVRWEMGERR